MNFFKHQDQARHSTRKLVFLFGCAVLTLIVVASLLLYAIFFYSETAAGGVFDPAGLHWDVFISVALAVLLVVGLGSLYRLAQLRGGGKVVAESLNGRLLHPNTQDPDERKVLNVVEEMAIASGVPVPPVYLLEDPGINAFAAGYQPQDAVIGVTRGCIQSLSRNELQGVIAHEFSHILNGDMRLNTHLMGIVYGIMVIGLIGYFLIRSTHFGMYSRARRDNKAAMGMLVVGLGLAAIGYGGTFFGNLIKAAVSRQREFLADASAVQFTRNPQGIAGALKKIASTQAGSAIGSADVSEISHMLFEEGGKRSFAALFATHPPLAQRIRRIEPDWDGSADGGGSQGGAADTVTGVTSDPGVSGFAPERVSALDSIGEPTPAHLAQAERQLAELPRALSDDIHSPFGARAAMFALVLAREGQPREAQNALLQEALPVGEYQQSRAILQGVEKLPREEYLMLVDLALPSLKQLSARQYRDFMSLLTRLMVADEKISLFEWCLFKILTYNLGPVRAWQRASLKLERLAKESAVLLSALAAAGHSDTRQQKEAFQAGIQALALKQFPGFQDAEGRDMEALEQAVGRLKDLKPLQKPRLLKAMVVVINADGKVTAAEGELLRAVASLLDCPIPPLLASQRFL